MVFGEPLPNAARIFSIVGRTPARSSWSAARSTSLALMPRDGGVEPGWRTFDSIMDKIIHYI